MDAHKGYISALQHRHSKLFSGGKDGCVKIWEFPGYGECKATINFNSMIRAIDMTLVGEEEVKTMMVACRDGSITLFE